MTHRLATLLALAAAVFAPALAGAQTVRVNIASTPPGAAVFVDTLESNSIGNTPLTKIAVPRGRRTLLFVLDGFENASMSVDVRRARETFTATLTALARLELTAPADGLSTGADVLIDGQQVGTLPFTGHLRRGRHELRVTKSGFQDYSQWIEVRAGETRAQTITLVPARVAGSMLVAGDVPGAEVFVDGTPRGNSPVVVDDLDPGPHSVEIRAQGLPPFSQTVAVQGGQRITVNPSIRPTRAPTGSLRVLANVPEAQVVLDGDPVGAVPADAGDVESGTHILEVMAPGHRSVQQEVQVVAGERRVVRVALERLPEQAPAGTLRVVSPTPGAQVYLDGASVGGVPFERSDVSVGQHYVTVQAEGHRAWRRNVTVVAGSNVELAAELEAVGTLKIRSNVPGAIVSVDGEVVGRTPFESTDIVVGERNLLVSAPGYRDYAETVSITAGGSREIEAQLTSTSQTLSSDELRALRQSMVPYAAGALPAGQVAMDLSLGWPYFFDIRFGVGILPFLDAGVGMRTYFNTFEFVGRAKAALRVSALGFALYGEAGGGLGPDSRSVGFFEFGPMLSLFFGNRGAFTLRMPIELYTEKCGELDDNDEAHDEFTDVGECGGSGSSPHDGTGARMRFGGMIEVVTSPRWNLFAQLEGVISGDQRKAYQDVLGTGNEDTLLYFRVGLTHKF